MASTRWSRESEVLLLSFLNLHIELFRDKTTRQQALEDVAVYLTDKMGVEFSTDHVSGKLFRLWNSSGPENSQSMGILYKQGVTMHTLPRLNSKKGKAGLLEEIGARTRATRSTKRQMQSSRQQGSERALRNLWELKYCCPFDHDDGMGMIGCDGAGCVVWQHQLCCYPDADEAFLRATKHFCEACKEKRSQEFQHIKEKEGHNLVLPVRNKEMANNPLKADMNCHGAQDDDKIARPPDQQSFTAQITELKELNIRLQEERNDLAISDSIKNKRLQSVEAALIDHHRLGQFTTFGRSSSKEYFSLPLDENVVSQLMEYLRSQSLRIARSILHRYNGLQCFSDLEFPEKLRQICPGIEDTLIDAAVHGVDSDANQENLLATTIILLVKRLAFEPEPQVSNLFFALLDEYQHCLFQRDGDEALRSIHLAAWSRLLQNRDGKFVQYINTHSKILANRIVEALLIFVRVGSTDDSDPAADQPQNTVMSLRGIFEPVFQECLRFKSKAATSGAYYEMYNPVAGTQFDPKTMTLDGQSIDGHVTKKRKILFCLLPSIIKYDSRQFNEGTHSAQSIRSSGEFVARQEAQRADGTVLFPSLVTLQ